MQIGSPCSNQFIQISSFFSPYGLWQKFSWMSDSPSAARLQASQITLPVGEEKREYSMTVSVCGGDVKEQKLQDKGM